MRETAYRPSFVLAVIGKILRVVLFLAFGNAMFRNIPAVGVWTHNSITLLITTLMVMEFIVGVTFHRNLLFFLAQWWLRKGEYDFFLIRPVSALFLTCFRVIDFFDVLSLIPIGGLLTFLLWRYHFTVAAIGGFFLLFAAGYVILFALSISLAAINFWTLIPTGMGRLTESAIRLNRFPLDVLPHVWQVLLFYILPMAAIANIPTKYLLGTWSSQGLFYILAFAVISMIAALKFWHFALRRYSSVA